MVYILIYTYTLYNNLKLILFICITNLRYGLLLIFGGADYSSSRNFDIYTV